MNLRLNTALFDCANFRACSSLANRTIADDSSGFVLIYFMIPSFLKNVINLSDSL